MQASASRGTVVDVRIQRTLRAQAGSRPEEIRAVEGELRTLRRQAIQAGEKMARAAQRYQSVCQMLAQGIQELPEDVAWGNANQDEWKNTFEALFQRSRSLRQDAIEMDITQREHVADIHNATLRRNQLAQTHHDFVATATIDLIVEQAGPVEISLTYTVPGALWRPQHTAHLKADGTLEMTTFAAIWQHTGEDWSGVQVVCSTARNSLGTEPPLLDEDRLRAQRKSSTVQVQAREVAVQTTGPGSAAAPAPTTNVALPGVDDGGSVLALTAMETTTITSDGALHVVPLARFTTPTDIEFIAYPELAEKVFLRSTQRNAGTTPILAGPVELLRNNGAVGTGEVLFVAPGAAFELSFGVEDALRVHRRTANSSTTDPVDKWRHQDQTAIIDVSNISGETFIVRVVERVPVSEVDEIRIEVDPKRTTGAIQPDRNGFCSWEGSIGPRDRRTLQLRWRLSVAPGVTFEL